jgi:hypothetical protein
MPPRHCQVDLSKKCDLVDPGLNILYRLSVTLGGHFFLSSMPADPKRLPLASDPLPPHDGAVKTNSTSTIMKRVLSSTSWWHVP